MKCLVFSTPSHKNLIDKFLLPSFKKNIPSVELDVFIEEEQICTTGNYHESGWAKTQTKKIQTCIDYAVNQSLNEIIVFFDSDIIVLKDFQNELLEYFKTCDFVAQNAFTSGLPQLKDFPNFKQICSGFYAFRNNENNLNFLKIVKTCLEEENNDEKGDQFYFNMNRRMLRMRILDDRFLNTGKLTNSMVINEYCEGVSDFIPTDSLIFHANWTKNYNIKYNLMKEVYNKLIK